MTQSKFFTLENGIGNVYNISPIIQSKHTLQILFSKQYQTKFFDKHAYIFKNSGY